MKMILHFRDKVASSNAYEIALYVIRKCGIWDLLKSDMSIEGINRMENLNALLDGIKEFVEDDEFDESAAADKSLHSYIQNVALLTDQDQESEQRDYVTLMSVHSAKGLEFGSIFVVGMEEKLFPSFMSMSSPEQLDEERRLFYVAITRAKKFLTLTYAVSRYQYGQIKYNDPSRFLEEIPEVHLEMPLAKVTMNTISLSGPQKSGITGHFKPKTRTRTQAPGIKVENFKASPAQDIQPGAEVLHLRFGKGKVLSIDGQRDKRVATIFFKDIDNPQRRIMLKFAKLQVL